MPMPNGGFAYFPSIELNYKIRTVWTGGVQIEQPIFMGGKILAAYKMATLGKQMAQLNENLTATEVILETDQAYALMVKAQEMNKVAESYNTVLQELMKNVQSAYKHGLKSKNDVLKVQVKLNESELAIRKAQNALRLANMNLCHLIGKPLIETLQISDNFPVIEQALETQINDITHRPEYALLNKEVDIAKQQVKLSRSELLPQVGIRGSYDYIHGLKMNEQTLFDKGNFSVMLNVTIPFFHFGERINKVRAAKVQLEQTRMKQADLNEKMFLELIQAANNLEEAKLEASLADRSLEQADENRRISKGEYDAGLEPLSDHLEAQALWQQAYETKVDAHFQLYLSYVKYLKTVGQL
jgi:outer membrane protein TolC